MQGVISEVDISIISYAKISINFSQNFLERIFSKNHLTKKKGGGGGEEKKKQHKYKAQK